MAVGKMVKRLIINLVSWASAAGKATSAGKASVAGKATSAGKATAARWATAVLMSAVLAIAATSCDHKDMCFMHPHAAPMKIKVDWSDFTDKETPTGMTVIVYPQDGGAPITTKSNNTSSVLVNLAVGFYNTIVFNQSETEFGTLELRNLNNYREAEVIAIQASPVEISLQTQRGEQFPVHRAEFAA